MERLSLSAAFLAIFMGIIFSVAFGMDISLMTEPVDTQCTRLARAYTKMGIQSFGIPVSTRDNAEGDIKDNPIKLFTEAELSSRVGFGLSSTADAHKWALRLGAGWYIDWAAGPISPEQLPEHWQMIRFSPGCIAPPIEDIQRLARNYPGGVWIIGNEPDIIVQDNLPPEAYARNYHIIYKIIKEADPKAAIAVAGVAQASPLRLEYLDRVLQAYQTIYHEPMPVDWWTVHGFVLNEDRDAWGAGIPPGFTIDKGSFYREIDHANLVYFKRNVLAFREWMSDRGYRNKPLAITEFGILEMNIVGISPETLISQYLWDTFSWLDEASDEQIGFPFDGNRLVQRWAWFSLADSIYPISDLADLGEDEFSEIGLTFREYNLERLPLLK